MHHHGSCQSIMKAVSDRETVKINSYKRHALRYFFMGNDILHCVFVCVGSVSLEESKGECWFEDQHFCFSHFTTYSVFHHACPDSHFYKITCRKCVCDEGLRDVQKEG